MELRGTAIEKWRRLLVGGVARFCWRPKFGTPQALLSVACLAHLGLLACRHHTTTYVGPRESCSGLLHSYKPTPFSPAPRIYCPFPPRHIHLTLRWMIFSALSVFREMQRDGVAADRNSYFFAVSACSRGGEATTAQELLAEMTAAQAEGGPAPDLLLYAVTAKACAGGRSWRQAFRLLEEMSAAGGELTLTAQQQ